MRMNLQPQHRERIDQVLGNIEFNRYHRWFDKIFVISAISSALVLVMLNKTRASRPSVFYDVQMDKFP